MIGQNVHLALPDGKQLEVAHGSTIYDAIGKIGKKLQEAAISASLDGKEVDLTHKVEKDAKLVVHTFSSNEGKETYWHSTSHLMAYAITELYPGAQFTVGPAIEEGFFYDIDYELSLTPEDLIKIETRMKELAQKNFPVTRYEWSKDKAIDFFKQKKQNYKVELVREIPDSTVSVYEEGTFIDLCTGPHVINTGRIAAVKLLRIAGAYWKGDARNKQLQRIYGISFPTQRELDEYIKVLEEREARDHRKIGKEMKIFMFSDEVGQGLPLWLPNGEQLFHTLSEYMRKQEEDEGCHYVRTPHILKGKMFERTGHIPYYKESMYAPIEIDGEEFYLKPMNCPLHHTIYSEMVHSYKELPFRVAEPGNVYRYELSGGIYGIIRPRGFTQNDAHIYCTPAQVEAEVRSSIKLITNVFKVFGIGNYWFRLSLPDFEGHPEKYAEEGERWEQAAQSLRNAIKGMDIHTVEAKDEAAFYGPKIDIQTRNVRGKEESVATVQLDIMVPKRVGLTYIDETDKPATPTVIHRAVLGSYERFIGFLLEQTMGKFPLWLSPVQVKVLPLSEKFKDYAHEVFAEMKRTGIRAQLDDSDGTLNYRIRDAQMEKVPYMLIVGEKEQAANTVSIRTREGNQENGIPRAEWMQRLKKEIDEMK